MSKERIFLIPIIFIIMFAVPVVQAQAVSPSILSLINKGSSVLNAIGVGGQVNIQNNNHPSSHAQPTATHCAANQTTTPSDCPVFNLGSLLQTASDVCTTWCGPAQMVSCTVPVLLVACGPIGFVSTLNSGSQCLNRGSLGDCAGTFWSIVPGAQNFCKSPFVKTIVNALPAQTTSQLCSQDPHAAGCNTSPPPPDNTNNHTTQSQQPVDCTASPNDPSCPSTSSPQSLCPDGSQPDAAGNCLTATLPPANLQAQPLTTTCPDGSQPDAAGNCPSPPPPPQSRCPDGSTPGC